MSLRLIIFMHMHYRCGDFFSYRFKVVFQHYKRLANELETPFAELTETTKEEVGFWHWFGTWKRCIVIILQGLNVALVKVPTVEV